MIVIVRLGNGIELVADDERTDQTPTPEWIEDTAHRLGRVAVEMYEALPDDRLAEPAEADPE